MVSAIDILIDDFLSPALFTLLGIIVFKIYTTIRKRYNTLLQVLDLNVWEISILPPRRKRNDIWITYALIPPSKLGVSQYTIEEGDARSLFTLVSFLSEAYNREQINVQNHEDIRSELDGIQNVICLSGPLYNKTTELYIGRSGSPVRFEQEGESDYLVADNFSEGKSKKFETVIDDGRPKKCYGLILCADVKIGNTYQRVTTLAGISTLSTYGSILVLQSMYDDSEFQARISQYDLHKESKWAIIFSINSWGANIPWHRHTGPFRRGDLEVKIERVYTEDEFRDKYSYNIGEEAI